MATEPTPTESNAVSTIHIFDCEPSRLDVVRLTLDTTTGLRITESHRSLDEGIDSIDLLHPDLVVTACRPGIDFTGLDVIERLRARQPSPPIVVLTAYPTPGLALKARRFERASVISTQLPVTNIVEGLRTILAGQDVNLGIKEDPFGLTEAEFESLDSLALGYSATEIAAQMVLSVSAISAHIGCLLSKTSSSSQLEAVAKAIRAGICAPPRFLETGMHPTH